MTRSHHASGCAKRSDTLIASAVLVALIAGWVMNFVSVKQLALGLDTVIAHAMPRQA
jgi:predicted Co/Zn/Cd cation transporter (cation efflux family)